MTMPAVSVSPPTITSFAAMVLAASKQVTNSAVQVMKRHDMAVRSYYGLVDARARAVVLLSGGVDSATAAGADARARASTSHALTFAYGQRHAVELEAARRGGRRARRRPSRGR